ncbi:MAG: heme biosynthesis protein HemY [Alphaproteobacteria bacterium]|nr:heme biosynthesis protein HemY [Alphaproteobacteria bacterium]
MIRLIIFLIIAIAAAWLSVWFADNPGEVKITEPWFGNSFSPPFGILILGVLAFGVAIAFLYELYRTVVTAPKKFSRHRRQKRKERGYQELATGLVAAAAGDVNAAKASTRRAEKLLEKAPTTLLLGARSAQLDGNDDEARGKFKEMLQHKETEFLGLRGLLAQAIKDGDREEAIKLAKKAYLRRPNTPWVLTTLFDLQTEGGEWREAMATVNDMARQKLIDAQTATRHRAILLHLQAEKKDEEGRAQEAFDNAKKAHKLLPGLAPIAVNAARLAVKNDRPRPARKILETSWKVEPHPALARALAGLDADQSPTERYKTIERLHKLNPNSLEGELALAEQAAAAEQWPAAREALERAVELGATASVFRMFAEVERATGGDADKIQGWLAKAVDAPSDPTWLCKATGETQARWSAFGPDGKFDSLRWGSPPTIVPMLNADAPAELILPDTTRDVPARNQTDELAVAPARPAAPQDKSNTDQGKVDAA